MSQARGRYSDCAGHCLPGALSLPPPPIHTLSPDGSRTSVTQSVDVSFALVASTLLTPTPLRVFTSPMLCVCALLCYWQHVYFNRVTKKVSRANPAKIFAAATAAYEDAMHFVTNPPTQDAAAALAKSGGAGGAGGGADGPWQEMWDPTYNCMYWYNSETGAVSGCVRRMCMHRQVLLSLPRQIGSLGSLSPPPLTRPPSRRGSLMLWCRGSVLP